MRLGPLKRLAPCEREAGRGERRDGALVAGRGELCERSREQIVARRPRRARPEPGPGRSPTPAIPGAIDQIVVHECRHVHELDGDAGDVGLLPIGRGGEEDE